MTRHEVLGGGVYAAVTGVISGKLDKQSPEKNVDLSIK